MAGTEIQVCDFIGYNRNIILGPMNLIGITIHHPRSLDPPTDVNFPMKYKNIGNDDLKIHPRNANSHFCPPQSWTIARCLKV